MKKTLTLLVASTALTAAIGVPAWSAMHTPEGGYLRPFTALFDEGAQATPLILASDDDDDDRRWREGSRRGHDDDDDCDDDDAAAAPAIPRPRAPSHHRRTGCSGTVRRRRFR